MKKQKNSSFQFELLINHKIICQRNFDVRNYNRIDIYEAREMANVIVDIIENDLIEKTLKYLWESYNPYEPITHSIDLAKQLAQYDNLQINVSSESITIVSASFNGHKYPPKIRYDIDIRSLVPSIIMNIRLYLSN